MSAGEAKLRQYLEKVTVDLRKANRRAEDLERRAHEPIAIIGMACRYPGGVSSPDELWSLMDEGREGIVEFPADRGWDLEHLYHPDPDHPGTTYVRQSGFLESPGHFDAEFFGISPREALVIDPQQRLLLEISWEALEGAGIDPASLRGESTGVFAGVMNHDYGSVESGVAAGQTSSFVSGRIAYTLGLVGPAVSIDTACSSSLVAVHLASQALRNGECSLALAGGATVLSTPNGIVFFSRQRGLATDGRCKAFADAADGADIAEGVGVLVLERLSQAKRNNHPILALIRGSAVNQDGASNGLTAPHGPSQERVIRQALASARLTPKDIDAVEAHGTGTTLGDPIEAGALLATYGQDRETPLRLGSIKSNIGHTQAAAGVAGVIKMTLAMREGVLPKTLHVDEPSSKVEWDQGKVELLTEAQQWETEGAPRRAGISAFGASGTNAHLILEQAPEPEPSSAEEEHDRAEVAEAPVPGPLPVPLSAKSEPALREAASRLERHIETNPDLELADLAHSLVTTRTVFAQRAVVVGEEREDLLEGLAAIAGDESHSKVALGVARSAQRPVFLFPGQGSQWLGMGAQLADSSPTFERHLRECEEAFAPHLDWSPYDVVTGARGAPSIERIEVVQPALFATMVCLARLWEELGVRPAAVVGHSQGEIAAAHVAGALTLKDAAMLAAIRSQIIAKLAGQGAMVSVALPVTELHSLLQPYEGRIEIAASNGPASTILSAERQAAEELLAHCEKEDIRAREIPATIPSHSARVEPLREEVLSALAGISPQEAEVPFHSTVTGKALKTTELDASYWYRNLRQPVLFEQVTRGFLEEGQRAFIEISPHPVFVLSVRETIEDALEDPSEATVLGTLRREEDEAERFSLSLAEAHANGIELDWQAVLAGRGAKRVPLPTYPFQGKRYWLDAARGSADASSIGQADAEHPLLGAAIEDPSGESLTLTGRISLSTHPWLADHAVAETVLLPGAAFLELALAAAERTGSQTVAELTIEAPLVLPEKGAVSLQVSVAEPDEEGRRVLVIHSRPGEVGEWTRHAEGILTPEAPPPPQPIGQWPPPAAEPIDLDSLYDELAEAGFEYGPAFQGLTAAWGDGEDIYVEVSLPEEHAQGAERFGIHPALLDAALHGVGLLPEGGDVGDLAFSWKGASLRLAGAADLRVRARSDDEGVALEVESSAGTPVASIRGLSTRSLERSELGSRRSSHDSLFRLEWIETQTPSPEGSPSRLATLDNLAIPGLAAEVHVDLPALLEDVEGAPAPDAVLVDLRRSAVEASLPETVSATVSATLELVQAWVAAESLEGIPLVFLSENAIAAREGEDPDLLTAPLWGLVRSAHSEHPGRFGLLDTDGSEASLAALPAALSLLAEEPQLALREGALLIPRMTVVQASTEDDPTSRPIDPDSTVLITGGTSGLGALVARHLVAEHGARHLLLASRRGPGAEGAAELGKELEELGASVRIAACDVSERKAVRELIDSVPAEHPLGAVIHSARQLDDGVLESLDAERLERVMRPKVDGAWHLHELTEHLDLSQFLLFSSAAGVLGNPGQANYAAANAFLDALAAHRGARGLPATSLAWGILESLDGKSEELDDVSRARLGRLSLTPVPPELGLELFDAARARVEPLLAPTVLEGASLRAQAREGTLPAVLRGLVRAPVRRDRQVGSLGDRLSAVPEAEREGVVLEVVRSSVAAVLGHASAEGVEPNRAFLDLGLDSLGAVELRNRLAATTGLRLPATLVFDHPSAAALAEFLLGQAMGESRAVASVSSAAVSEEPIAIVGMACRYPGGVSSAEELWELLVAGADAIAGFPDDRGWDLERLYHPDPDNPGTSYVRYGGFVDGVGEFDPGFFGISPREAPAIDPQQRLLLEASWEALEHGGIDPLSLRGSQTGVFAGAGLGDYATLAMGPAGQGGGLVSSGSSSVVSGRVSYTFGFEGPAITVDTACSSSLVAMHLAAQALRQGECSLALASGVLVMATPSAFIDLNQQRGLAPDGRCKAFAEAADGVGFSEGAGVVLLERLSDAQRNGHPILAVIKGSAVNQDGASNGLTAPNGPSQERVIRQALANARLRPEDIDAVEAHGTGTLLGDPIEAGALLATYGQERGEPLRLGSIKSNIGHTAAAAGVAGVIKMVMALREGVLPKTLHADRPSSKIDWSAGEIELLTEARAWEANGRPRRAGVSSFGVSGTNAHVILEEPPGPSESGAGEDWAELPPGEEESTAQPAAASIPLFLSAKSEPALRETAGRLRAHLQENPDCDPLDVAYSLATTRPGFEHRGVALGADREQLLDALAALAMGTSSQAVVRGLGRDDRRPIFLFPGHGSQWPGMAVELSETSAPFARKMSECREALEPQIEWSFERVLRGEEAMPPERADIVQPMLFAMMVSLAELWRSSGVEPAAVVGQSQGEIAAAHVAGGLSLEDAARAVALRSKVLMQLAGRGKMISVGLGAARLDSRLERWGGRIEIAALTGPTSAVLSGEREALDELMGECAEVGVRAKDIPGAVGASHSVHVEALREELLEALGPISPRSGGLPFHSTVTGDVLDTAELDADYWYCNARQTVLLEPTLRALLGQGQRTFIEISPHPVLALGVQETIEQALSNPAEAAVLPTMRREEGGLERFVLSLAEAHAHGAKIDWETLFEGTGAKPVRLPTYPFQRKRYWLEGSPAAGDVGAAGLGASDHPLLGAVIDSPEGGRLQLTGRLSVATHGWLADHAFLGAPLLPGSALVEMALVAGREAGAEAIEELSLRVPLLLPESGAVQLRVSVDEPDAGGRRRVAVHSRPESERGRAEEWACNAEGVLSQAPPGADSRMEELAADQWPPEGAESLDVELAYDRLANAGFDYGAAFRGLRAAWRREGELFVEVGLGEAQVEEAGRFVLHPALLDAAAHAGLVSPPSGAGIEREAGAGVARPCAWRGLRLYESGAQALRVRIAPGQSGQSLVAVDATGAPVLALDSVVEQPLDAGAVQGARHRQSLYRIEWSEAPAHLSDEPAPRLALLGESEIHLPAADRYPDIAALLEGVEGGHNAPEVVVVDGRPGEDRLPGASHTATSRALELLQAWLAEDGLHEARLTVLTEGALPVLEDDDPDLRAAAIPGLLRSAHSEHGGLFALVDVDGSEASWEALPAALALGAEAPELGVRGGKLLLPQLARLQADEDSAPRPIDPETTVLITGGTSGIGALVARHLVAEHGARHLLLLSRSGLGAEGATELKEELEGLGAVATVAACDVADRGQLEAAIGSIAPERPLGAVVHSAAVLDNDLLASLDAERLERVMRPKVDAAWHLHQLTEHLDLSQFLLFSSLVGTIGGVAQANYAAGNLFLDALAVHRRNRGLPALSMAWGGWLQGTTLLSELSTVERARLEGLGFGVVSPEEGLELFDIARAVDVPQLVPVEPDRVALRAKGEAGVLPPILAGLVPESVRSENLVDSFRARLAAASEAERAAVVLDLVRTHAAVVLGYESPEEVEPGRFFQEMGVDSLGTMELRNRVAASTGVRVPILALADHPTPEGVAQYLLERLSVMNGDGAAPIETDNGDVAAAAGGGGAAETTWVSLLGRAREEETIDEYVDLITEASRFRRTFEEPADLDPPAKAIRLAEGGETPSLVLVPSAGPMSGPHEYVRLAKEFQGERTVLALSLPGFTAEEVLPGSIRALTRTHAEAIAQSGVGTDLIVAGHSSGGWVAHALVAHLESMGVPPVALVLLDTYEPRAQLLNRMAPVVLGAAHNAAEAGEGVDDLRLTAMGGYRRIFSAWQPEDLETPTVMVRASESVWGELAGEGDWRATWHLSHLSVDTPGAHFTMMTDYAADTAQAIRDVLNKHLKSLDT